MISTYCVESGEPRVYVTRVATVCSYFVPFGDGVIIRLEPGFGAIPEQFNALVDDVYHAVIGEMARRLGIAPGEVLHQSFAALRAVVDPELPVHYRYARRARGKSPNRVQ